MSDLKKFLQDDDIHLKPESKNTLRTLIGDKISLLDEWNQAKDHPDATDIQLFEVAVNDIASIDENGNLHGYATIGANVNLPNLMGSGRGMVSKEWSIRYRINPDASVGALINYRGNPGIDPWGLSL